MARTFNGSSQYLKSAATLSTISGASRIAVGFWLTTVYAADDDILIELSADSNVNAGSFKIIGNESGTNTLWVDSNGNMGRPEGHVTAPSSSVWHHLLAQIDYSLATNEISLYVDGVLQTLTRTANSNNTGTFGNYTLNVMSRNGASLFADGSMAELAVWVPASVLTVGEALALADGLSPLRVRQDSLVNYWPLLGRVSPEPDLVGSIDLTVTGATQSDHPRVVAGGRGSRTIGYPPISAGGTAFTVTVTDAAGSTDTNAVDQSVGAVDGAGSTDFAALTEVEVREDSGGSTDTSTVAIGRGATTENGAGSTDTSSITVGRGVTQVDAAGSTDSFTLTWDRGLAPVDPGGSTDTTTYDRGLGSLDSAGSTDSATMSVGRGVTATDDAGSTDSATITLTASVTVTDDSGSTDSSVVSVGRGVTAADDAGSTDSALVARAVGVAATDPAGSTDLAAFTQADAVTDSVGSTDSAVVNPTKGITATDSAGSTDFAALTRGVGAVDPAGSTDYTVFTRGVAAEDSAGSTDAATVQLIGAGFVIWTDDSGSTDTATVVLTQGLTVAATDSAGSTDSAEVSVLRGVAAIDPAGSTDYAAYARGLAAADDAGSSDGASVALAVAAGVTAPDDAGSTDSVALSAVYDRPAADDAGASDSASVVLTASRVPMPVSLGAAGAWVAPASSATVTPAYPADDNLDMMLGVLAIKPNTATVATPANWVAGPVQAVGGGTQGAGTGACSGFIFTRVSDGSLSGGSQAFTITGGSSPVGVILAWKYDGTYYSDEAWETVTETFYSRTTASTTFGGTGAVDLDLEAGDVLGYISISADDQSATHTITNLTVPGCVVGATVQSPAGTIINAQGNDISAAFAYCQVTSGTSSGAPSVTVSGSTSETGGGIFFRLRATGVYLGQPFTASTTDSAGSTDSVELTRGRDATDDAGSSDSATIILTRTVAPVDNTGSTDSASIAAVRACTATDSAGSTDSASVALAAAGTVASVDDAGSADSAIVSLVRNVATTDSAGSTDTAVIVLSGQIITVDDAGSTDSWTRLAVYDLHLLDDSGVTDLATIVHILPPPTTLDYAHAEGTLSTAGANGTLTTSPAAAGQLTTASAQGTLLP